VVNNADVDICNGTLRVGTITQCVPGSSTTFTGPVVNQGPVTNNGTTTNNGAVVNNDTVTNNGDVVNNANVRICNGTLRVGTIAQCVPGSSTTFTGPVINEGPITNNGTTTNNGAVVNNDTVVNEGPVTNNDTVTNNGNVVNNADVDICNGTLRVGTITQCVPGGSTTFTGPVVNEGPVTNNGTTTNVGPVINNNVVTNNDTVTNNGDVVNNANVRICNGTLRVGTIAQCVPGSSTTFTGPVINEGPITNNDTITNNGNSFFNSNVSICPGPLNVSTLNPCTPGGTITVNAPTTSVNSITGTSATFTNYNLTNSNVGTGTGSIAGPVFGPGGNTRQFRTLTGLNGIDVTTVGSNVFIDGQNILGQTGATGPTGSTGPTGGENITGANVGGGSGLSFRDRTGDILNFRTIISEPNSSITVSTIGNIVEIGTSVDETTFSIGSNDPQIIPSGVWTIINVAPTTVNTFNPALFSYPGSQGPFSIDALIDGSLSIDVGIVFEANPNGVRGVRILRGGGGSNAITVNINQPDPDGNFGPVNTSFTSRLVGIVSSLFYVEVYQNSGVDLILSPGATGKYFGRSRFRASYL
jgi:hypothetical protein